MKTTGAIFVDALRQLRYAMKAMDLEPSRFKLVCTSEEEYHKTRTVLLSDPDILNRMDNTNTLQIAGFPIVLNRGADPVKIRELEILISKAINEMVAEAKK